jgi:7-carboxy-7-deazaguanine synthase
VGIPSVFVRVSGCNLRCVWCDTPYASWHPEGPVLEVSDVADQVLAYGVDHVVLTGGEPMLFEGVAQLAELLKAQGRTITVETAGTLYRELPCDLMSISPKLAGSTPDDPYWRERHDATRLQPEVLQKLIDRYDYQLKFVVDPDREGDLEEIERVLSMLNGVQSQKVLLMPEGTDSQTLLERSKRLVEPCMQRNWRLTSRMHIDLFGNTKGT